VQIRVSAGATLGATQKMGRRDRIDAASYPKNSWKVEQGSKGRESGRGDKGQQSAKGLWKEGGRKKKGRKNGAKKVKKRGRLPIERAKLKRTPKDRGGQTQPSIEDPPPS